MKLKHSMPKRGRFMRDCYTEFSPLGFTWWYNEDLKAWQTYAEVRGHRYASHQPCKSVKAFRRMLKKAPYGVKFILQSIYVGITVTGYGSNKTSL